MNRKTLLIIFLAIIALFAPIVFLQNNAGTVYTISFKVDNSVFYTIETKGFERLELPADPLKQDFTFDGWYFDKDVWFNKLTEKYYMSQRLNSDIDVYAKFIQSSKIVSFYFNGTEYFKFNFLQEDNFALPQKPNLEGYVFDGWYFDNNVWANEATVENIEAAAEHSIINVYAKMLPLSEAKMVTFYLNNEVYYSEAVNNLTDMPKAPSVDYYTFDCYN